MADKIRIVGGKPSVDLQLAGFDSRLLHPDMAHWSSFEAGDFTLVNGRIVAVSPRAGDVGLVINPDSIGPVPAVRDGLSVGKYANAVLNYLHAPIAVNGASVTVAAIVHLDNAPASGGNDLIGMFETGSGKKLWIWNGRWQIRDGAATLATSSVYPHSGWFLLIWSQHGGECALHVERLNAAPETLRVPSTTNSGTASTIVFGADEIVNGNPGAVPSVARAWGDCIGDSFVWRGVDILAGAQAEYRTALSAYFNSVYGAAA